MIFELRQVASFSMLEGGKMCFYKTTVHFQNATVDDMDSEEI
jgi:hypothetical protein